MPGRRTRDQQGATAVEFAFVVMPLLMIVFGIMQYSFYFYSMQGGSDAARQAARQAATGAPTSCAAFRTSVAGYLSVNGATNVATTRTYTHLLSPTATNIGDQVSVTVTFDSLDFQLPWVPMPNGGKVISTAKARVDNLPDETIGPCA